MSDVIKIVVNETAIAKTAATQIPLQTAPTEAADMSATGATDGQILTADGSGGAAWEDLPDLAVSDFLGTVATEAAMTALVGQEGDWCIRSDVSKVYIVTAQPSSSAANWTALTYPADAVLSVAGKTGSVDLVSADITDASQGGNGTADDGKIAKFFDEGRLKGTDELHIKRSDENSTLVLSAARVAGVATLYAPETGGNIAKCASTDGAIAASDVSGVVPLTGSQAITGALGLSGTGPINAQTDGYTLVAADNGKIVTLNKGTALTVTVPASLGAAFSCMLVQLGAGQVTVAASGTTINSYGAALKLSGQHAAATLVAYAADTFNLAGNLTA